ncbi:hypothetical protein BJ998_001131 [Kutzneria kofuensis]|uniref:Uncharacterized protein n=1 Tax=Kutzneria kofuensis TaxID=103725 RepID=A0A7W9KC76_9PSEU|nr:hypothetical protein [Kutzneria kofuensis]
MIITQTITAVPTVDGRTPVHTVRFSHPAPDAPERRWTDVTPGSPRCEPVRFLAPPSDDPPTEEDHPKPAIHKGQSSWQRSRRVGVESKARPRSGWAV